MGVLEDRPRQGFRGAVHQDQRRRVRPHGGLLREKADVYLDADSNVLGLEALSFEDLAQAIEERGGKLEVPEKISSPIR